MKSLLVVSALVALAIAAPAQPGDGLEITDRAEDSHLQTQSSLPDLSLFRERKSPSEISTSSSLNNGVSNSEVHIDAEISTPTARSFNLKKPLIVKKKYGYQVYRDSEEEKAHADSNETCGRQVKVKLCNEDKLRTSVTGSAHEDSDIHTTEEDVKHSIKMAKEAVENLQKDLLKMEMKADIKNANKSQTDIELHEDIEATRQALKHILENFGTLESMSLHATTTRNSEDMHDVHVTIAKTEEERMAQWKEAMENIQKNVEIAKNIEDSFKAASNQDDTLHLDKSEAASTVTVKKTEENIDLHGALSEGNNLRLAQGVALEAHHQQKKAAEEMIPNKETNEHLSGLQASVEQNTEDDMKTAPSEMIEIHLDNIKNQEPLISENHKINENEKSAEAKLGEHTAHTENKENHHLHEKSAELDMDMLTGPSEHHVMRVPAPKLNEEGTETKFDLEKDTAFKTSENVPVAPITTGTIIKPLTSNAFSGHQRNVEQKVFEDKIEHLEKEKSADDDLTDFLAKSADLDQHQNEKEVLHKERLVELEKSAETLKSEQKEILAQIWNTKPKEAVEIKKLDSIPKAAEQLEHTHFHNLGEHNENVMLAKSVDHTSDLDHQKQQLMQQEVLSSKETVPEMKAAEEKLQHLQHMHNAHWAHENKHLDHLSSMKAAEEFGTEFRPAHGQAYGHGIINEHNMDHLRNSHLAEHGHIPSKLGVSHEFEVASHVPTHAHYPSRYHHNSMTNSHLHEMNGMGVHSNFHPSMRDAMEGFGSDHMFRWQPSHESARVAYGSGLSSSSASAGAVGVFPNANIGGCGIPLLLSCSPSVVSGSLAKAHSAGPSSYSSSSYNSPSYRTEEDFGFHNKREIKKTNEMRTSNVLRSPTIVKQKSSVTLENKM